MNREPNQLLYNLSNLAQEYYKLSNDFYMLEVARQKIEARSLQTFDKTDIMEDLGRIQHRLNAMHGKLITIADLLKS